MKFLEQGRAIPDWVRPRSREEVYLGDMHMHFRETSVDGNYPAQFMMEAQAVLGFLAAGGEVSEVNQLLLTHPFPTLKVIKKELQYHLYRDPLPINGEGFVTLVTDHDVIDAYKTVSEKCGPDSTNPDKPLYHSHLDNYNLVGAPRGFGAVEGTYRKSWHFPHMIIIGPIECLENVMGSEYFNWEKQQGMERPVITKKHVVKTYPFRPKLKQILENANNLGLFVIVPHIKPKGDGTSLSPKEVLRLYCLGHKVDAIEIYNQHSTLKQVKKRVELAKRLFEQGEMVGLVGGSDAHILEHIGLAFTQYRYKPQSLQEALEMISEGESRPVSPVLGKEVNKWVWQELNRDWWASKK